MKKRARLCFLSGAGHIVANTDLSEIFGNKNPL